MIIITEHDENLNVLDSILNVYDDDIEKTHEFSIEEYKKHKTISDEKYKIIIDQFSKKIAEIINDLLIEDQFNDDEICDIILENNIELFFACNIFDYSENNFYISKYKIEGAISSINELLFGLNIEQ